VASDGCHLFVADGEKNRVLVYNTIPVGTTNPTPDEVLGQTNLLGSSLPSTPDAMSFGPGLIFADANGLYVTDGARSRVLNFSCSP
jgi:hypothetical protein